MAKLQVVRGLASGQPDLITQADLRQLADLQAEMQKGCYLCAATALSIDSRILAGAKVERGPLQWDKRLRTAIVCCVCLRG